MDNKSAIVRFDRQNEKLLLKVIFNLQILIILFIYLKLFTAKRIKEINGSNKINHIPSQTFVVEDFG